MGGGRGVFLQIQSIGFETGTKLSGWNLDDNLLLDVFKAYMKLFLRIHYRNLSKISILKQLVPIFSLFRAFFVILWLWGKDTWLWIGSAGFESQWDQIFFTKYSYILFFLCGERFYSAIFKKGSAIFVAYQNS